MREDAFLLKPHQGCKGCRIPLSKDVVLRDPEGPQFLLREVDAAAFRVFPDVAQDVGKLQRNAQISGVGSHTRVPVAEDLQASQAHGGRDPVAVHLKVVK